MVRSAIEVDASNLDLISSESVLVNDAPLIFKGGCLTWPAYRTWSFEYFQSNYGTIDVPVSMYDTKGQQAEADRLHLKLTDFIDQLKVIEDHPQTTDNNLDSYIAGWHYSSAAPTLNDDIIIPRLFENNLLPFVNDNIIKYDWRSLFIGSCISHTPVHTDSFYVAVWIALIRGSKIIRYVPSRYHKDMAERPNLFSSTDVCTLEKNGVPVYEAIIEQGDIVYHPPGWWHQVKNTSQNIALSFNYIPEEFYLPFEQQLLAKSVAPILLRILELRRGLSNNFRTEAAINALGSSDYLLRSKKLELLLDEVRKDIQFNRAALEQMESDQ